MAITRDINASTYAAGVQGQIDGKAASDMSNVDADDVAALVGAVLYAATVTAPLVPARLILRPESDGSPVYILTLETT